MVRYTVHLDGVCALAFLLYVLKYNVDVFFDPAHGVHNDVLNAIYAAGLRAHLFLTLLRLNIPCGPWSEDMRYKQVTGSIDEFLQHGSFEELPLFADHFDDMLSDPDSKHLLDSDNPVEALWTNMKTDHAFKLKDSKCMLGRFLEVIRRIKKDLTNRSQKKFWYIHTALELDMMSSLKVTKSLWVRKPRPLRVRVRKRILRKCTQSTRHSRINS